MGAFEQLDSAIALPAIRKRRRKGKVDDIKRDPISAALSDVPSNGWVDRPRASFAAQVRFSASHYKGGKDGKHIRLLE